MELIETPTFTRQVTEDDEYRLLQFHLLEHPAAGPIIPGSGGLRSSAGDCLAEESVVVLESSTSGRACVADCICCSWYSKNVQSDLTREQLRTLRELVSDE